MIIINCDICKASVNNFGHWYDSKKNRNMYELKCLHDSGSITYEGMIICHKCIQKLFNNNESEV